MGLGLGLGFGFGFGFGFVLGLGLELWLGSSPVGGNRRGSPGEIATLTLSKHNPNPNLGGAHEAR